MIDAFSFVIDLVNRTGGLFWSFASLMFVQTLILVAVLFVVDLALRRRSHGGPLLAVGACASEAVAPRIAPHAGERSVLAPARAGFRGDGLDDAPA